MFCTQCGKKLSDDAMFCSHCGTPVREMTSTPSDSLNSISHEPCAVREICEDSNKVKVKRGKMFCFLLGAIITVIAFSLGLLFLGKAFEKPKTIEGSGFETPELAVNAYMESLKEADFEGVLSTYALESYVHNINLAQYTEIVGAYIPTTMPLPGNNNYVDGLNLIQRLYDVCFSLSFQYVALVDPDSQILDMTPLSLGESSGEAFLNSLIRSDTTEVLSSLETGEILQPETLWSEYASDLALTNRKNVAKTYGADEVRSVVLEISIGDRDYLFCPDVVRYGESWYILQIDGTLCAVLNGYYGLVSEDTLS